MTPEQRAERRRERERQPKYREANRLRQAKRRAVMTPEARKSTRWFLRGEAKVTRVLELFQRGTERQRERLANRLLSQFDPTVRDSRVDQWLADYNSLE